MQITQHRAIRLVRALGASQQLGTRAGHRQLEAEHLDLARIQRQRRPARHQRRAPRDVGGHRRVAVAVAANPRAEANGSGVERQASVHDPSQGPVERSAQLRNGVPDRLLEHRHAGADLVERRRPFAPDLLGVPGTGNLAAHRLDQRLPLRRRQVRPVPPGKCRGDAVVLVLQRPPHDLGRMRRDHQLDAQAANRLEQRLRRHPGPEQPGQRFFDRSQLWTAAELALQLPAPPHAVMLFGDVGEVEKVGEAPRHGQRRGHRHRPQLFGERFEVVAGAAAARPLRQRADPLDPLVVRNALVAAQCFAQQFAEQPHVVAERLVRIAGHRFTPPPSPYPQIGPQ